MSASSPLTIAAVRGVDGPLEGVESPAKVLLQPNLRTWGHRVAAPGVEARELVGAVGRRQRQGLAVVVGAVAVLVEEHHEALEHPLFTVDGLVHVPVVPDGALDDVGAASRRAPRDHFVGGGGLSIAVVLDGELDLEHSRFGVCVGNPHPARRAAVSEGPFVGDQTAVGVGGGGRVEVDLQRSLSEIHIDREAGRRELVGFLGWRRRRWGRRDGGLVVVATGEGCGRDQDQQQSGGSVSTLYDTLQAVRDGPHTRRATRRFRRVRPKS